MKLKHLFLAGFSASYRLLAEPIGWPSLILDFVRKPHSGVVALYRHRALHTPARNHSLTFITLRERYDRNFLSRVWSVLIMSVNITLLSDEKLVTTTETPHKGLVV